MDNWQKGEIAELKVAARALEKGLVVSRPLTQARYDLLLDDGTIILRAQIKWCEIEPTHSTGVVQIDLRKGKACKRYGDDEVDIIICYLPKPDAIVAFGPDRFNNKPYLTVRYEPTRNGQKRGCTMLEDCLW